MRAVKLTLRFLIKWFPAVALTAAVTFFATVYGIMAVLMFCFAVLKGLCMAFAAAVIACIIIFGLAWLYERGKRWIYED